MSGKTISPCKWFILRDGSQAGPFTEEQIGTWAKSGHINPTDQIWQSDWAEWRMVREVLNSRAAPVPPPVPGKAAERPAFGQAKKDRDADPEAGQLTFPIVLALWGSVAAGITGLLDFLKPLTEDAWGLNSVGVYFFAGLFLAPTCYLLSLRDMPVKWRKRLKVGALVFTVMASIGTVSYVWSFFDPEIAKRGVFAKVPAASALQELLLKRIGFDTREILDTTKRIEKKIDSLPIDTSDDPRKELARIGVQWNEGILGALRDGDLRVLDLFMRGGYKAPANLMEIPLRIAWNPEVQNLLLRFPGQLPNMCPDGESFLEWKTLSVLKAHPENVKFFFAMCDRVAFQNHYRAQLHPEKHVAEYRRCVAEITAQSKAKKLPPQKPGEEVNTSWGYDFTQYFDAAFVLAEVNASKEKVAALESIRKDKRKHEAVVFDPPSYQDKIVIQSGCHLAFDSPSEAELKENEEFRELIALAQKR